MDPKYVYDPQLIYQVNQTSNIPNKTGLSNPLPRTRTGEISQFGKDTGESIGKSVVVTSDHLSVLHLSVSSVM